MLVDSFWPIFGVGCIGGILAEALKWYRMRENLILPKYAKLKRYWFATGFMVLAGGFLSVFYGEEPKSALLVLNIGASTPLIIQALAAAVPVGTEKSISSPAPSVKSQEEVEVEEAEIEDHRVRVKHGLSDFMNFLSGR